jgi:hypothetical protein
MANVIDRLSGPIFPLLIQHGWNEVILQITLRNNNPWPEY